MTRVVWIFQNLNWNPHRKKFFPLSTPRSGHKRSCSCYRNHAMCSVACCFFNSPQVSSLQAGGGSDPPRSEDTSNLLSEWCVCVCLHSGSGFNTQSVTFGSHVLWCHKPARIFKQRKLFFEESTEWIFDYSVIHSTPNCYTRLDCMARGKNGCHSWTCWILPAEHFKWSLYRMKPVVVIRFFGFSVKCLSTPEFVRSY